MTFVVTGSGKRVAESYESGFPAVLHIEYEPSWFSIDPASLPQLRPSRLVKRVPALRPRRRSSPALAPREIPRGMP